MIRMVAEVRLMTRIMNKNNFLVALTDEIYLPGLDILSPRDSMHPQVQRQVTCVYGRTCSTHNLHGSDFHSLVPLACV